MQLACVRGHSDVEVVNVQRRAASVRRFADDVAQQIERFGEGRGEGELECLGSRLTFACLRQIGGEKTIDDDGVKLSVVGVRQSVAAFDFGEEALCDEQALVFKGGRKHHIGPQLAMRAALAPAGVGRGRRVPDARGRANRRRCTNASLRLHAKEKKDRTIAFRLRCRPA